jgi:hypothetical protein
LIELSDPYAAAEVIALTTCATLAVYVALAARRYPQADFPVLALGGIMGAAFFTIALGIRMLDPRQIGWLTGDWLTHFLGWHAFRHEPWTLPPGRISSLAYPVGTSVGYTDSIPIAAILFKPFDRVLSADFQYLGLWLLTAFVLQGVAGAALAGTLTRRQPLRLAGTAFFVLSPILLSRIGHPALAAHWQLLAAMWLTVAPPSSWPRRHALPLWIALAGISAATHPYLTVMVLALACAFLIREIWDHPAGLTRTAGWGLAMAGAVLATWWACGYLLLAPTDVGTAEVDNFSMNLLAPVMPMGTSAFLPDIARATSGQYEGFNYLGLGQLLLVGCAAVLTIWRPPGRDSVRAVAPLACVSLALAIFALSPSVTLGDRIVLEVRDDLWQALSAFRSTGRFGWPLHYLVMYLALAATVGRLRPRLATAVVTATLLVQAVDLYPTPARLIANRRLPLSYTWTNRFFSDFWTRVPPAYRHLELFPTNICGRTPAAPHLPLSHLAGSHGLTINAASLARYSTEAFSSYCAGLETRMATGQMADDTLYIIGPEFTAAVFDRTVVPAGCLRIDGIDVCMTLKGMAAWRGRWSDERRDHAPHQWTYSTSGEIAGFAKRLEGVYREVLGRPAAIMAAPLGEAAAAIGDYLGYRARGCDNPSAAARARANLAGLPAPPCAASGSAGLAGREEVLAFRRELERTAADLGLQAAPSSVDLEGQAVWVHEFVTLRRRGCSSEDTTERIVGEITGRNVPLCR